MSKPLAGQRGLVIGGSRGIGAAIVERLSADGSQITFTYLGSADAASELAEKSGARHVKSDIADREALESLFASAGPIDHVIINAGTFVMGDPLEIDPAEIDRLIDINIRGPYFAAVEAARFLPERGRIVVIGSVNGDRMPMAGGAAYAMSKAAIQGMVQGLARDFGSREITINAVQPGPTDTSMNPADGPIKNLMHESMAIKRHIRPAEIAGLVAYVVGPDAAMVTGAHLSIDGGYTA